VIGARQNREAVTFPVEGVDGGSISMLAVRVGLHRQRRSLENRRLAQHLLRARDAFLYCPGLEATN